LAVFDFNCDVALKNDTTENAHGLEIAKYMSSVNVAAFHAGNQVSVKRALEFASEHELAVGALVGHFDGAGADIEEIDALVIYQMGAIDAFARTMGLEMEQVRLFGAMYTAANEDIEFAKSIAHAIKQLNPWLTLILGNYEFKKIIENEIEIKCAYEVTFTKNSSVRELREMPNKPDTVHFETIEDAKKAWDVIKPSPMRFNRVKAELE
jgi:UPF0271 protein